MEMLLFPIIEKKIEDISLRVQRQSWIVEDWKLQFIELSI